MEQLLARIAKAENKLMQFIAMVSKDMKTMEQAVNQQTLAIQQLQKAQMANTRTLAGFNDMRVAYSPQPIGPNTPGPRTVGVPQHAPMTPQIIGHVTPDATQAHDNARAGMPIAHQNEEDAVFYSGGEDD